MAVVTGGSSGIGRSLARRLASESIKVLIVARKEADIKATAEGYPPICAGITNLRESDDDCRHARPLYFQYFPAAGVRL